MEEKKLVLTSRKALKMMETVRSNAKGSADVFLFLIPTEGQRHPRPYFVTIVRREDILPEYQKDIQWKTAILAVEVEHPENGVSFLDPGSDYGISFWRHHRSLVPGDIFCLSDGTKCCYHCVSQADKTRFLKQLGIVGLPQSDDYFITIEPEKPEDDDEL